MKLSKAHQAAVDARDATQREMFAYHHILTATVRGTITRVGSVYDKGDGWVWKITFTPRLRDAVIVEVFDSATNQDKSVRCFFLDDIRDTYTNRSFDSTDLASKFQTLYWKAVEMERAEQQRAA